MYYYSADYQIIQKGLTDCKVFKTCAEDMGSCKKQENERESGLFKGTILN
jgi:hypothetical protein